MLHRMKIKGVDLTVRRRGISRLSIAGVLYGRVVTGPVKRTVDEELGGYKKGRGSVDQTFALCQMQEEAQEKKENVICSILALDNAYDK